MAIAALTVAAFAAGAVFVGLSANRDQVSTVNGDIIKLQGEIKDLQIQIDELKDRK